MTSNIGSQPILEVRDADERGYQRMREQVLEALRRQFRPEFRSRVDEIVVFAALTKGSSGRSSRSSSRACGRRLGDVGHDRDLACRGRS